MKKTELVALVESSVSGDVPLLWGERVCVVFEGPYDDEDNDTVMIWLGYEGPTFDDLIEEVGIGDVKPCGLEAYNAWDKGIDDVRDSDAFRKARPCETPEADEYIFAN
jgi:hypothetical protein